MRKLTARNNAKCTERFQLQMPSQAPQRVAYIQIFHDMGMNRFKIASAAVTARLIVQITVACLSGGSGRGGGRTRPMSAQHVLIGVVVHDVETVED